MIDTIIYQFHSLDVEIFLLLKAGYKTGIQAVYFSGVDLQQSQIKGTDPRGTYLRRRWVRAAAPLVPLAFPGFFYYQVIN
jgi:hypothetical protein